MAGTVTWTFTTSRTVNTMTADWTASSSGVVPSLDSETVSGEILRAVFNPDSGATAPTNNYDVTLTDADGIDILAGQGANQSSGTVASIVPAETMLTGNTSGAAPFAVNGPLTLAVANAGASNGGILRLYYR
jgi:hypothetical protein